MAKPKPTLPSVFLAAPVPVTMVEAIDDYRFALRLRSRAEAVRLVLDAGLKALARQRKEKEEPLP